MEEPRPLVTFNTTQLHRDRRKKKLLKSAPLYSPAAYDSEVKQALYSTSLNDIQALAESRTAGVLRKSSSEVESTDPVLAYIMSQRLRLGLKTEAMKYPDESERETLVAMPAPITGIKDLRTFSKKLSSLHSSESKVGQGRAAAIANEFVYALRKDSNIAVRFNPYDIYMVSPDTARRHDKHYTVSAFTISKVSQRAR